MAVSINDQTHPRPWLHSGPDRACRYTWPPRRHHPRAQQIRAPQPSSAAMRTARPCWGERRRPQSTAPPCRRIPAAVDGAGSAPPRAAPPLLLRSSTSRRRDRQSSSCRLLPRATAPASDLRRAERGQRLPARPLGNEARRHRGQSRRQRRREVRGILVSVDPACQRIDLAARRLQHVTRVTVTYCHVLL